MVGSCGPQSNSTSRENHLAGWLFLVMDVQERAAGRVVKQNDEKMKTL